MLMHSLKWFSNRNKSPLRILPYGGDAAPLSTVKPSRVRDLLTIISRQKNLLILKHLLDNLIKNIIDQSIEVFCSL